MRKWITGLVLALLMVTPGFAKTLSDAEIKAALTKIVKALVALEPRLEKVTKPTSGNAAQQEDFYQQQDAILEGLKKEVAGLDRQRVALSSQLPMQSPYNALYGQTGDLINAFGDWLSARSSWVFAGAKNPSLKVIEANNKSKEQTYKAARKQLQEALK